MIHQRRKGMRCSIEGGWNKGERKMGRLDRSDTNPYTNPWSKIHEIKCPTPENVKYMHIKKIWNGEARRDNKKMQRVEETPQKHVVLLYMGAQTITFLLRSTQILARCRRRFSTQNGVKKQFLIEFPYAHNNLLFSNEKCYNI